MDLMMRRRALMEMQNNNDDQYIVFSATSSETTSLSFSSNGLLYAKLEEYDDNVYKFLTDWEPLESGQSIALPVAIKGSSDILIDPNTGLGTFSTTGGYFKVSGPISSLFKAKYVENIIPDMGCYKLFYKNLNLKYASELDLNVASIGSDGCERMFEGCSMLSDVPELPALNIGSYAYRYMFSRCSSLTTPQKTLPSKNIPQQAYQHMFSYCTALEVPPKIEATSIQSYGCSNMFDHCESLSVVPELNKIQNLARLCFTTMFAYCAIDHAPELPFTTLVQGCYKGMFTGCPNIVNAPVLPARTLVDDCYNSMFKDCRKLEFIEAWFDRIPRTSCTSNWVAGVADQGTFVKGPTATWNVTGNNGVPSGWTVKQINQ